MQWLVILNYRFLLTMEVYLFRLHKEFIINLKKLLCNSNFDIFHPKS